MRVCAASAVRIVAPITVPAVIGALCFIVLIIRDPLTNVNRKLVAFRMGVTYNVGMAKKTLPPDVRDFFVKMGRKGGKIGGSMRAANMTAKERSESARRAVQARWAKKKAG